MRKIYTKQAGAPAPASSYHLTIPFYSTASSSSRITCPISSTYFTQLITLCSTINTNHRFRTALRRAHIRNPDSSLGQVSADFRYVSFLFPLGYFRDACIGTNSIFNCIPIPRARRFRSFKDGFLVPFSSSLISA